MEQQTNISEVLKNTQKQSVLDSLISQAKSIRASAQSIHAGAQSIQEDPQSVTMATQSIQAGAQSIQAGAQRLEEILRAVRKQNAQSQVDALLLQKNSAQS